MDLRRKVKVVIEYLKYMSTAGGSFLSIHIQNSSHASNHTQFRSRNPLEMQKVKYLILTLFFSLTILLKQMLPVLIDSNKQDLNLLIRVTEKGN